MGEGPKQVNHDVSLSVVVSAAGKKAGSLLWWTIFLALGGNSLRFSHVRKDNRMSRNDLAMP